MVYLLKMVIFDGYVTNKQMVNTYIYKGTKNTCCNNNTTGFSGDFRMKSNPPETQKIVRALYGERRLS